MGSPTIQYELQQKMVLPLSFVLSSPSSSIRSLVNLRYNAWSEHSFLTQRTARTTIVGTTTITSEKDSPPVVKRHETLFEPSLPKTANFSKVVKLVLLLFLRQILEWS